MAVLLEEFWSQLAATATVSNLEALLAAARDETMKREAEFGQRNAFHSGARLRRGARNHVGASGVRRAVMILACIERAPCP